MKDNQISRGSLWDYLLIFSLLTASFIPAVNPLKDELVFSLFIISLLTFILRKKKIDINYVYFVGIFFMITLTNIWRFNVFNAVTFSGFFLKIMFPYFIVKSIGKSYIPKFLNLMLYITIISFIFYFPMVISNSFRNFLFSIAPIKSGYLINNPSFFIYNLNVGEKYGILTRNSGPFWEPGVFGGLLNISLIFNWFKNKKIFDKYGKIFLLGIITTQSTTSYVAMFIVLLISSFYGEKKNNVIKLFYSVMIIGLFFYSYSNINFLGGKVKEQVERSYTDKAYLTHRTRFSSGVIDLSDFMNYPIFGRGKFSENRFDSKNVATNLNNGTTDFLVRFGVVGFVLYFWSIYKSFKNYGRFEKWNKSIINISLLFTIIILILGMSENYFLLPFFWGLCHIRFIYKLMEVE